MADETSELFTAKAAKKLRSPDDLDEYVRVTNPSIWVVLAACASLLIGMFAWGIMARVSIKLDIATESATYARMLSLPAKFFKEYNAGELACRIGSISALSKQTVSVLLGTGLSALLSLIYVGQIFYYTPALMVPALLVIVAQTVLGVVATILTVEYGGIAMEANAKTLGVVTALLNGIQKIDAHGHADHGIRRWGRCFGRATPKDYDCPGRVR